MSVVKEHKLNHTLLTALTNAGVQMTNEGMIFQLYNDLFFLRCVLRLLVEGNSLLRYQRSMLSISFLIALCLPSDTVTSVTARLQL